MTVRLAPGVHAADVRGDLVFLDARRNSYSCLAGIDVDEASARHDGVLDPSLVAELIAAGLLVGEGPAPRDLVPQIDRSARADAGRTSTAARPTFIDVLTITAAALRVAVRLHGMAPSTWFRTTLRRRRTLAVDVTRGLAAARHFHALRPWFPRTGRCLPSSMLLLEFLALRGLRADWVFGVRTRPFEAHCWVELEGVVLNDDLEHVCWFTPIVRV